MYFIASNQIVKDLRAESTILRKLTRRRPRKPFWAQPVSRPDPYVPASGQHRLHPENLGSRKNFFEGGYLRLSRHTPSPILSTASTNLANLSPMCKGDHKVFWSAYGIWPQGRHGVANPLISRVVVDVYRLTADQVAVSGVVGGKAWAKGLTP